MKTKHVWHGNWAHKVKRGKESKDFPNAILPRLANPAYLPFVYSRSEGRKHFRKLYGKPAHDELVQRIRAHKEEVKALGK